MQLYEVLNEMKHEGNEMVNEAIRKITRGQFPPDRGVVDESLNFSAKSDKPEGHMCTLRMLRIPQQLKIAKSRSVLPLPWQK